MNLEEMNNGLFQTLAPIIKSCLLSYLQKKEDVDNLTWVKNELTKRLTNTSAEEINDICQKISTNMDAYQERLDKLKQGMPVKDVLKTDIEANDIQRAGEEISAAKENLAEGNALAMKAQEDKMINITANDLINDETNDYEKFNKFSLEVARNDLAKQSEAASINAFANMPIQGLLQQLRKLSTGIVPESLFDDSMSADMDKGIKMALAVGLKIMVEQSRNPLFAKMLPMEALTGIACMSVEGAKIIGQMATGKINKIEAMERIKQAAIPTIAIFLQMGAPILLRAIPAVGIPLSYAVSFIMAGMSTEEIQTKVAYVVEEIAQMAKTVMEPLREMVFNTVKSKIFNLARAEV